MANCFRGMLLESITNGNEIEATRYFLGSYVSLNFSHLGHHAISKLLVTVSEVEKCFLAEVIGGAPEEIMNFSGGLGRI